MDFGFEGFESSDSKLDIELEDFEIKRKKKFERIWQWSQGGSVLGHRQHEGVIYMSSRDAYLYAVDSATGKIKWKFRSGGVIFSQPAVFDGMVSFGAYDGCVYMLDKDTGKELWRFRTGGQISGGGPSISDDSVFFGSRDGYIYCVDHDGNMKWRYKTSDEIACSICLYKGRIYSGGFDFNFYCLDAKTGRELWRFRTGGEVIYDSPTTVKDGRVYFGSFDNNVYCLNAETGKEIWRARVGKYGITCPVVEMDGRFYVGTREGAMFCLDSDGKELWRFRTGGMIIRFSCRDGKVYFPSEDGNLYVVSDEGKEIWRFKLGQGGSFDQPSFRGNMVFVGSMDCHLYAIDENIREETWRVYTSSGVPSVAPPPHEEFSLELRREARIEDAATEIKYKKSRSDAVSLSDYHIESEYSATSDYKQRSDYDVNLVMLDEVVLIDHMNFDGVLVKAAFLKKA